MTTSAFNMHLLLLWHQWKHTQQYPPLWLMSTYLASQGMLHHGYLSPFVLPSFSPPFTSIEKGDPHNSLPDPIDLWSNSPYQTPTVNMFSCCIASCDDAPPKNMLHHLGFPWKSSCFVRTCNWSRLPYLCASIHQCETYFLYQTLVALSSFLVNVLPSWFCGVQIKSLIQSCAKWPNSWYR